MARRQKIEYRIIVDYWRDAVQFDGKCTKARIAKFLGISVRTVKRGL